MDNITDFAAYKARRAARGSTLIERLEAVRQAILERKGDGEAKQHSPQGQAQMVTPQETADEQAPSA